MTRPDLVQRLFLVVTVVAVAAWFATVIVLIWFTRF